MVISRKNKIELSKGDIIKRNSDGALCKYEETFKVDLARANRSKNICYFKICKDKGGFLITEKLLTKFFEGHDRLINVYREVDYL